MNNQTEQEQTQQSAQQFRYNNQYIQKHKLDPQLISQAGIEAEEGETFVAVPGYWLYYISNFGRMLSKANGKLQLIEPTSTGKGRSYDSFNLTSPWKPQKTYSVNHLVALVFCRNDFGKKNKDKLHAHHLDHDRQHNNYHNILLLPERLHRAIHRIEGMVLIDGKDIFIIDNPLDLHQLTGLSLADIIVEQNRRKRGRRKLGVTKRGWTIYNIKGWTVGYFFKEPSRTTMWRQKKTKAQ